MPKEAGTKEMSLAAGRSTSLLQNPRESPGTDRQELGASQKSSCSGTGRGGNKHGIDHKGFGVDGCQEPLTPMVYTGDDRILLVKPSILKASS